MKFNEKHESKFTIAVINQIFSDTILSLQNKNNFFKSEFCVFFLPFLIRFNLLTGTFRTYMEKKCVGR